MAQAELSAERGGDWLPANPWLWLPVGVLCSLLAYVWVNVFDEQHTGVRLLLVVLGLAGAAAAVTLRLNSSRPAFLDQVLAGPRKVALGSLFLAHAALVGCALFLLAGGLLQGGTGWNFAGIVVLNLLVVPVAGGVAWHCLQSSKTGRPLGAATESAALLVLAGVCAFLCCWALYLDAARAERWDSMRLVLGVLAAVAVLGAGLVLLPRGARRGVISVLVLFHFGGILTAVMSPAPSPWIFSQLWVRVYRPYLQFLYLNNAYHFYAPDPGPSCFLWFRIEYENDKKEKFSEWVKVPRMTEQGLADHVVALRFQRRLAMNDHTQAWDTNLPPAAVADPDGRPMENPIYFWRKVYSTTPPQETLGKPIKKAPVQIPFDPVMPLGQQYRVPQFLQKKMIASYAAHVYHEALGKKPGYTPVSVRVYKVVHQQLNFQGIAEGYVPVGLRTFQPFYVGKFGIHAESGTFGLLDAPQFDEFGQLKNGGDPLLYWLVPFVPTADGKDMHHYYLVHAGDHETGILTQK